MASGVISGKHENGGNGGKRTRNWNRVQCARTGARDTTIATQLDEMPATGVAGITSLRERGVLRERL